MDDRHNPDQVAQIATILLQGCANAEPHHAKAAIVTARMILDLAHGHKTEAEEAADEETAAAEANAKANADARAIAAAKPEPEVEAAPKAPTPVASAATITT